MRRTAIVVLCLSSALLILGSACSSSDEKSATSTPGSPSTTAEGSSVTVGALLPLTGDLASYGETSQLALDEAVAALQADGNRVALSVKDTATDPAKALDGLKSLQAEGVKLVIGPYASSEVRAVKDFADKNGIILISPLSTATSLAVPDDNVLRFTPDDEQEGIAVANLAYADGIRTIVPMTRDDEGNRGLQSSMKPAFEALGGTVAPLITYPAGTEDFTDTVRDLVAGVSAASAQGGPVGVYLTAFGEVTKLFNAAAGMPELESLTWYGSDSVALSKGLLEDPTAAAFAVKAGYPNPILGLRQEETTLWKPVVDRLTQRLGRTPDAFALAAYDALVVGVDALKDTSEGADAPGLRKAIVEAAQDHTGLTGPTQLNAAGDRSIGNYDFWAVCGRAAGDEWVKVATYTAGENGSAGEAKRETGC